MMYPKDIPVRLTGKDMLVLRLRCYMRDGGRCVECKKRVSFKGKHRKMPPMHMAHIKSRGAGGSDTIDNVLTKCPDCHIVKEHNGGKPCPPKGAPQCQQ